MDLNLVRLRLQLSPPSDRLFADALAGGVFETPLAVLCARELSSDPEVVRRHQKPGLPFVFTRPANGLTDLLLMGPAIAEYPLVLQTVADIARLSPNVQLLALDYQESGTELDVGAEHALPVLSAAALLDMAAPCFAGCHTATIELLTPLRLAHHGRELGRFAPTPWICNVLRRISSLAAYYGEAGDPARFSGLAALAGSCRVVGSEPQRAVSRERGVTGSFRLRGPLSELGPLLYLGSLFNSGKGASRGLGRFRIVPTS